MGPKRLATKINFFFDPELLRRANDARRGGGVGAAAVQGCSAVPIADGDYDVLSAAVCPTHTMYSVVHCRGRNVPALVTYLTSTLSHVCNVINFGMNVLFLM